MIALKIRAAALIRKNRTDTELAQLVAGGGDVVDAKKLHGTIRLTRRTYPVDARITWNLRNWALPLSFGGGIWADEEIGDYGQVYSCEWINAFIVGFLCFWLRIDWGREE